MTKQNSGLDEGELYYRMDYNYGSSKHTYSYIISNPLDVLLDAAARIVKQAKENKEHHHPPFINVSVRTYDRDAHKLGQDVVVFFNAEFCKQLR
jgi:hypothetical protein